jgi:hypothetical protein
MIARAEPAAITAAHSPAEVALLPRLPEYVAPAAPEAVVVTRDPFVSGEASMPHDTALPAYLPPNAGASGEPLPSDLAAGSALPVAATLLATARGPRSRALVSESGSVRVVAVGDRLSGSIVRAILPGVLSLEDGTTLRIGAP